MSTSPRSGLEKIAEAFDAVEAELGLGEPSADLGTPSPEPEGTPAPETDDLGEQSVDEANEQVPTKFSDLKPKDKSEETPDALDLDTVVDVPGLGEMTIRELADGQLRRRDYTQKTQELADQRRALEDEFGSAEKAVELYNMLREDTTGTIAKLAYEAGLIDQDTLTNAGGQQGQTLLDTFDDSDERIAELVEQRVREALASDEAVRQVRENQRVAKLNADLDNLAETYSVDLDDDDKIAIAQNAVAWNEPNLELVFLRMQRQLDEAAAAKSRVKDAGGRLKSTPVPTDKSARAKTAAEAWDLAEQLLAKGG